MLAVPMCRSPPHRQAVITIRQRALCSMGSRFSIGASHSYLLSSPNGRAVVPGRNTLLPGTFPSSSLSLHEVHGVRMGLVALSLVYELPQHLLCCPAAKPQGHRTGRKQTLSDVDFGERLTQEGTKENRYMIYHKREFFFLLVLFYGVCVCLFSKLLFWSFLFTNEKKGAWEKAKLLK